MAQEQFIKGFKFPDLPDLEVNLSPEGFAPWSYSKMSTLRKCPFKFYLQYVLKVKQIELSKSFLRDVGKAAHRIIEFILMGKDVSKAFKATKVEYVPKYLTEQEWEEGVDTLEMSIHSFKDRIAAFELEHKVKRYLQEIQIGVTRDWQPTGFWSEDCFFRGVIDLAVHIVVDEEKGLFDALFIDHKTGAPAIMGIRNFQSQLDVYKLLFHYGISPIEGGSSGIHFIRDGEIKVGEYSTKEQIETTIRHNLEFTLESAIEVTKELGYFKHIAGSHCKWCDYAVPCKDKSLVQIEKDSKKWFAIKKID